MKMVFYGGSKYVIPILEVLKNFDLVHIFTTEKNDFDPVIKFCKQNRIPYSSVASKEELKPFDANLAVVADFGLIIPNDILNHFPKGMINIHPSLLPKFRGPTPAQSAILNGETKTGVTLIKLDEHVDHGPILASHEESIGQNDTADSLLSKLFKKGANLLKVVLEEVEQGKISEKQQDHASATFTKSLTRQDGFIDFSALPDYSEFDKKVRAFYPWPGVWTKIEVDKDKEKIIKFLPGKLVQVEGKNPMSYKDFLNGYPNANAHLRLFLEKNQ